jgi:hypothetical protein
MKEIYEKVLYKAEFMFCKRCAYTNNMIDGYICRTCEYYKGKIKLKNNRYIQCSYKSFNKDKNIEKPIEEQYPELQNFKPMFEKVKKYKYVCCECGKKYPCKLKALGETGYKPEKCCYDKGMMAKWKLKKEKV